MKKISLLLITLSICSVAALACDKCKLVSYDSPNFAIKAASVTHNKTWGQLEFSITVAGQAGGTTPKPAGQLNGAPVLGYVFPTTLTPEAVGFGKTEGLVALALTAHPDFDDSPLWDENADGIYDNDGVVWHAHWVVLVKDTRVKGGLSVKEFSPQDKNVNLPPTAPNMPMYMDSPGFAVVTEGHNIRVAVPLYRVSHQTNFKFDAVSCYMQVSMAASEHSAGNSMSQMPMLGVYQVYSVLSKDLSLPYQVK